MKKNKIEIKLIKVNRNPKEKYVNINYYFQLLIINNDTFLTEKIIFLAIIYLLNYIRFLISYNFARRISNIPYRLYQG